MSDMFYEYLLTCWTNEPPTVTPEQLDQFQALGYITEEEKQAILNTPQG